jgi:hypothetical protein
MAFEEGAVYGSPPPGKLNAVEFCFPMKSSFSALWERHLAAMIVAGSHSHKSDTSLPTGGRGAP